jgi:hypothetical protein
MGLTTGSRLGPYEILSALGAGGMGKVYGARDAKLGPDVAITILPRLFVTEPERLARFDWQDLGGNVVSSHPGGVTQLLLAWSNGDRDALEDLLPVVYGELRHIAARGQTAGNCSTSLGTANSSPFRFDCVQPARPWKRALPFGCSRRAWAAGWAALPVPSMLSPPMACGPDEYADRRGRHLTDHRDLELEAQAVATPLIFAGPP